MEVHVDLGWCRCGAVHFLCPCCGARHDRGYVDGVAVFRCLSCGYTGHGFHPDHETDLAIAAEIRDNQRWNEAHGLPVGPFLP